jgi:hypothetical protein
MKALPVLAVLVVLAGCTQEGNPIVPPHSARDCVTVAAPFDTIRSYPGGGGLFLVAITPDAACRWETRMRVDAAADLHATVRPAAITAANEAVEVMLRPSAALAPGCYPVDVIAEHDGAESTMRLYAEVMPWGPPDDAEVLARLATFRAWCTARDPALAEAFATPEFIYNTYPEILIVEHNTVLTPAWEIRICKHVMAPPDDWMKIRFRRRGSLAPLLAAAQDSGGAIREIPVSEYPTLCGY